LWTIAADLAARVGGIGGLGGRPKRVRVPGVDGLGKHQANQRQLQSDRNSSGLESFKRFLVQCASLGLANLARTFGEAV